MYLFMLSQSFGHSFSYNETGYQFIHSMSHLSRKAVMAGVIGLLLGSSFSFAIVNLTLDRKMAKSSPVAQSEAVLSVSPDEYDSSYIDKLIGEHQASIERLTKLKQSQQ